VSVVEGTELFRPSAERVESSRMRAFQRFVEAKRGVSFASYGELWRWSVTDVEAFWSDVAAFFDVRFHAPPL
jgi:acetoacetyl-CoA synthetase